MVESVGQVETTATNAAAAPVTVDVAVSRSRTPRAWTPVDPEQGRHGELAAAPPDRADEVVRQRDGHEQSDEDDHEVVDRCEDPRGAVSGDVAVSMPCMASVPAETPTSSGADRASINYPFGSKDQLLTRVLVELNAEWGELLFSALGAPDEPVGHEERWGHIVESIPRTASCGS
ncbi:hypothetical protein ACWEOE_33270 [Amycolatopsis sp. NPDC004368]